MAEVIDQTADIELGIVSTKDLDVQRSQTESLRGRVDSLQRDIQQRIANYEQNRRQLTKQRADHPELRDKYDACLDRGDASGGGKILGQIRKSHEALVNLANNITGTDEELADLKSREDELSTQASSLAMLAGENWRLAQDLLNAAGSISGMMTNSIWRDISKLKQEIAAGKKIAQEILSQ